MYKEIIMRANRIIRKSRPLLDTTDICNTFYNNGTLEIGFLSKQCKNDARGSCLMCDYGATNCSFSTENYLNAMNKILSKNYPNKKNLLLCTNGSVFDTYQIPLSTIEEIIKVAAQSSFDRITFETHYQDVNTNILDLIKHYLPNKKIVIEMGLESINQKYQDEIILKNINIDNYEKTIKLIQSYGFTVEVNMMVGLPFLLTHEQYNYAIETINWALERNCLITIFPINIKPFTLLKFAHKHQFYKPISHWLLLAILKDINPKNLNYLTVAWYGNRIEEYEGYENHTIFPTSCNTCKCLINDFYAKFNGTDLSYDREILLNEIYSKAQCCCKNSINITGKTKYDNANFTKFINLIKKEILN